MGHSAGVSVPDHVRGVIGCNGLVEHLYWDLGIYEGGSVFEIELRGSAANVCFLDAQEYQAYLDGDEYEYHGGYCDVSPVELEVPYTDHWYLIVDGYEGRIKVRYEEILD